jgi:hypothetical protein
MLQTLAVKVATNPVVLETLEVLAVSAILYSSKAIMDQYIDRTARQRAERIVRNLNKRR